LQPARRALTPDRENQHWRALLEYWSIDSAEKLYECFDEAQHERKISNDFTRSSVRPEALEG
jgi:hypothetical protein